MPSKLARLIAGLKSFNVLAYVHLCVCMWVCMRVCLDVCPPMLWLLFFHNPLAMRQQIVIYDAFTNFGEN